MRHWVELSWEKRVALKKSEIITVRFYRAILHKDLWDKWVITKAWGRIGTSRGGYAHFPCDGFREGFALLRKVMDKRKRRGYERR
jgi:hypothetical protein